VLASFTADPAVREAAEWCAQVANEVAFDPDCAGPHSACDALRESLSPAGSRRIHRQKGRWAMVTTGPKISSRLIRISWVGMLDERDVALRCQFDEAVERSVDAMHGVQRA
jgi:hypothetical protein